MAYRSQATPPRISTSAGLIELPTRQKTKPGNRYRICIRFSEETVCRFPNQHRPGGHQNDQKPALIRQKTSQTAIENAISMLERQYGKGTVMRMGERAAQKASTIGTGALSLDLATGCGGYPKGRVIEIYGPESSGKTTLTLHAIAQCQAAGGNRGLY